MDRYNKETRSWVMSRIRGRNTKPELLLRRMLWRMGLRRFRAHAPLPGRPDVVYSRARLAVFVDGCFWHGCPKCAIPVPASSTRYWQAKLARNRARDRRVTRSLRSTGWRVVRLWEHQVVADVEACAERIESALRKLRAGSARSY